MSTTSHTSYATAIVPFRPAALPDLEGNWHQYQLTSASYRSADNSFPSLTGMLAFKQACALAYLGKRAQFHGGVCSKTRPRILTPQMIADLEASNRAKRFIRYPWMETLMKLLAEVEGLQDEMGGATNVISLLPASAKYRNVQRQNLRRQAVDEVTAPRFAMRSRVTRKLPR